jgi:hypothetical protein
MGDALTERDAVLGFLREEAARMRGAANEYTAKHNDRQTARKFLIGAEMLGKMANCIERGEHLGKKSGPVSS